LIRGKEGRRDEERKRRRRIQYLKDGNTGSWINRRKYPIFLIFCFKNVKQEMLLWR